MCMYAKLLSFEDCEQPASQVSSEYGQTVTTKEWDGQQEETAFTLQPQLLIVFVILLNTVYSISVMLM